MSDQLTKPLTDPVKTQQSLLALRDEILSREQGGRHTVLTEIRYKINSCLFSEYPHSEHLKECNVKDDIKRLT